MDILKFNVMDFERPLLMKEARKEVEKIEGLEVTASGGISFEEEITALRDVAAAAILGKAIYSGKLDLERAVKLAE